MGYAGTLRAPGVGGGTYVPSHVSRGSGALLPLTRGLELPVLQPKGWGLCVSPTLTAPPPVPCSSPLPTALTPLNAWGLSSRSTGIRHLCSPPKPF